eukprot:UN00284
MKRPNSKSSISKLHDRLLSELDSTIPRPYDGAGREVCEALVFPAAQAGDVVRGAGLDIVGVQRILRAWGGRRLIAQDYPPYVGTP